MTEYNAEDGAARRRDRTIDIACAAAAVATGVVMGWANHDVGIGITTSALAMEILRAVFPRPPQ